MSTKEKAVKSFHNNQLTSFFKGFAFVITFAISVTAFIFSTWPQFNPFNRNMEARAKAGDTEAQVFLAHHYYEVGDYDNSIYWYKVATMDKKSKNYANSLNNLAFLYLNYCDLAMEKGNHYHEIERGLFTLSAKNGSSFGRRNLYLLLVSTPEDQWTEINYVNELRMIKQLLIDNNEWSDDLSSFETGWEYVENPEEVDYSSQEEYQTIHVPGGVVTRSTGSGGEIVIPTYRAVVYRKIQPGPNPEFRYQDPTGDKFIFERNTLSNDYNHDQ